MVKVEGEEEIILYEYERDPIILIEVRNSPYLTDAH